MADSGVEFIQGDAFAFEPPTPPPVVDWAVSDVIAFPERCLELVERWCDNGWAHRLVFTMKFTGDTPDFDAIAQASALAHEHGFALRAKHFFSNKNELDSGVNDAATWVWCGGRINGGRVAHVTTIGGSASAGRHNYGHALAESMPSRKLHVWNPSQGSTGSDWAGMFLDRLLPTAAPNQLLLWESAINDWNSCNVSLATADYRREVLRIFLRRLEALLQLPPKSGDFFVLGLVFLWQPNVHKCWPHCEDDTSMYCTMLPVVQDFCMRSKLSCFALDVNALSKDPSLAFYGNSSLLFADSHHPTQAGHTFIAEHIRRALRRIESPASGIDTPSAASRAAEEEGATTPLRRRLVTASASLEDNGKWRERFPPEQRRSWARFESLLPRAQSFMYTRPHLEHTSTIWPDIRASSTQIIDGGKASALRVDRKTMGHIPRCGREGRGQFATALRFEVPFTLAYAGINAIVGPKLGALCGHAATGHLRVLVNGQMAQEYAPPPAFTRGIMAPQVWFEVAQTSGALEETSSSNASSVIEVCAHNDAPESATGSIGGSAEGDEQLHVTSSGFVFVPASIE